MVVLVDWAVWAADGLFNDLLGDIGDHPVSEGAERKAYQLMVAGKPLMSFKTSEAAEAMKRAIVEEPDLFLEIMEWDPGVFYGYVKFEEDQSEEE